MSAVASPVVMLGLQMRMATEFFRDAIFLFKVFFNVLVKGESLVLLGDVVGVGGWIYRIYPLQLSFLPKPLDSFLRIMPGKFWHLSLLHVGYHWAHVSVNQPRKLLRHFWLHELMH